MLARGQCFNCRLFNFKKVAANLCDYSIKMTLHKKYRIESFPFRLEESQVKIPFSFLIGENTHE